MRLTPRRRRTLLTAAGVVAALGFAAAPASAETAIAVTKNAPQSVVTFDTATPGTTSSDPVTGLPSGERLVAIDRRPATGVVYALSTAKTLYTLNAATGAVTSTGFLPAFSGGSFGFDFNPVVDRLRTVSTLTRNFRTNVDTGAVIRDGNLKYAATDRFARFTPRIAAEAYENNVAGATMTTLYGIDTSLNSLVIQAPPNDGVLTTVGPLGIGNIDDDASYDVSGATDTHYAILSAGVRPAGRLYTINDDTGDADLVGAVGSNGARYLGLTILP